MARTTISDIEVELTADELLRNTGNLGKETGCYTEIQLQRQERTHTKNASIDEIESGVMLCVESPECILPSEIKQWTIQAGLSYRESQVVQLRLAHCTWEYIAWEFSYNERTARRVCTRAINKLKKTAPVDVVAMLAEVFHLSIAQIVDIIKK